MVAITLYAKQKKRHRCTEQTFGLCGRRRGWDVSREQHQNMYIIKGETDHQPRLNAWDKCSALVHWEDPEGSGREGGGRGIGMGIHVNPWLIHVNVWQKPLQYCKVISLQLIKINEKKNKRFDRKKKKKRTSFHVPGGHLHVFFGKMFIRVLCLFFNFVACFSMLNYIHILCIFWLLISLFLFLSLSLSFFFFFGHTAQLVGS